MVPPNEAWTPIPQDESLLPALRALVECHTQVERLSSRHIESLGVTPAQFDVLVTLGDTAGMTCKELGERALITKGTLLPVLGRLEARGLVTRAKCDLDNRQTIATLTPEGQALYQTIFLPHIAYMRELLNALDDSEQKQLIGLLGKLRTSLPTGS